MWPFIFFLFLLLAARPPTIQYLCLLLARRNLSTGASLGAVIWTGHLDKRDGGVFTATIGLSATGLSVQQHLVVLRQRLRAVPPGELWLRRRRLRRLGARWRHHQYPRRLRLLIA